jgi:hypothetical protein
MKLKGKGIWRKNEGIPLGEIRIERYRESRYWGVWLGEELLAVTVYKCGAESVGQLAEELRTCLQSVKDEEQKGGNSNPNLLGTK